MLKSVVGTCGKCNGEIRMEENYVAFNRHLERADRKGVTVLDAEELALFHPECAPRS